MNNSGDTPLMVAARLGNIDVTKYLIKNGADINEKNSNDNTALSVAVLNNNIAMILIDNK